MHMFLKLGAHMSNWHPRGFEVQGFKLSVWFWLPVATCTEHVPSKDNFIRLVDDGLSMLISSGSEFFYDDLVSALMSESVDNKVERGTVSCRCLIVWLTIRDCWPTHRTKCTHCKCFAFRLVCCWYDCAGDTNTDRNRLAQVPSF